MTKTKLREFGKSEDDQNGVTNGVIPLPVQHNNVTKRINKLRNVADRSEQIIPVFFDVPGEPGKFLQGVERKE
ncbi:hypothetical protein [Christiangramia portivictoriae]|uniref:hypothetical protein n=1 Tax=Christiangramia portivictoriae TaxID=326069 RepID=UPI0004204242|nr:hypothetical protein [Christiangramia portivictoriae]